MTPFPQWGPFLSQIPDTRAPTQSTAMSLHHLLRNSQPALGPISLVVFALALSHIFHLFLSLSDLQLLFLCESQPQPTAILSLGGRGVTTVPSHPTSWNSEEKTGSISASHEGPTQSPFSAS